ncbi:MAG: 2-amino-4-hydroxy-6-hydroxymethyldihydropteridine diphosphokinase [Bdellovibrionales bacterium]|nr:2-amino-4-hydroxy-6-hydroxymethyldihydropteridine diphosphokinase [Bdellovibrionales bacterium]
MERGALLSIVHNGAKNLNQLQAIQKAIHQAVRIQKVSSIYEVKSDFTESHQHTDAVTFMGQSLCYVVHVYFDGETKDLHRVVKTIEQQENSKLEKEFVQIELLCHEDEILMLPTLTLPHPGLHQKAEYLVPASEILPGYEHPIIERSLLQIESADKYKGKVYFYAQSKNLVDFTT